MYNISPQVVNNYASNDSLNQLLKSIDKKIILIASVEFDNVRLALNKKIDYELYNDLCTYKEILLNKLLGCNCLEDQMLIRIVSKIKKLIK